MWCQQPALLESLKILGSIIKAKNVLDQELFTQCRSRSKVTELWLEEVAWKPPPRNWRHSSLLCCCDTELSSFLTWERAEGFKGTCRCRSVEWLDWFWNPFSHKDSRFSKLKLFSLRWLALHSIFFLCEIDQWSSIRRNSPRCKKVCFCLTSLKANDWFWQDAEGCFQAALDCGYGFSALTFSICPCWCVCVWAEEQWAGWITDCPDTGRSCSAAEGGFSDPGMTVTSTLWDFVFQMLLLSYLKSTLFPMGFH